MSLSFILLAKSREACARTLSLFERQVGVEWSGISFTIVAKSMFKIRTGLTYKIMCDDEIKGGFSWPRAVNLGIMLSDSDYVAYWSDDLHFDIDFLSKVQSELSNQHHDLYVFPYCKNSTKPFVHFAGKHIILNYGVFRKQSAIDAGMLDENFTFYCADGDLSVRMQECGSTYKICKDIVVTHKHIGPIHPSQADVKKFKSKHRLPIRRVWVNEIGGNHNNQ